MERNDNDQKQLRKPSRLIHPPPGKWEVEGARFDLTLGRDYSCCYGGTKLGV
jgi:hypothetical protein